MKLKVRILGHNGDRQILGREEVEEPPVLATKVLRAAVSRQRVLSQTHKLDRKLRERSLNLSSEEKAGAVSAPPGPNGAS